MSGQPPGGLPPADELPLPAAASPSSEARLARWVLRGALVAVSFGAPLLLAFLLIYHPELAIGPRQPLPFSHRLHAWDKQIDCGYCHPYTERSTRAGLPTVQLCLGCHTYIIPQHPEIVKLHAYDATRTEIPWFRLFYSPQHVWFPHYRHIARLRAHYAAQGRPAAPLGGQWAPLDRAGLRFYREYPFGDRPCIECHGAVELQDRLPRHTYYMGFCLSCHRSLGASVECTACHQ